MAAARSATGAGCCCGRLGSRFFGRCGSSSTGYGAGSAGATEVRGIPAVSLELETGSGQLLLEGTGATGRTFGQGCVRDFLQDVLGMSTGVTLVGVYRHGATTIVRENL